MEKLPFREYEMNAVWLEIVLIAQDLLAWTKTLCLDGDLAASEPKRLRYRLLHVAGRLAFHARQAILHLDWPWARDLATAFTRPRCAPATHALSTGATGHDHHCRNAADHTGDLSLPATWPRSRGNAPAEPPARDPARARPSDRPTTPPTHTATFTSAA